MIGKNLNIGAAWDILWDIWRIKRKWITDIGILWYIMSEQLQARAYYIPASKKMDDLIEHRETSDRFQLLDKNWKFQYFESIYDVKDRFLDAGI